MYKPVTANGMIGAINALLYRKEKLTKFLSTQREELRHTKNMKEYLPKIDESINELSKELAECVRRDREELETNKELSDAKRRRIEERIESALPYIK